MSESTTPGTDAFDRVIGTLFGLPEHDPAEALA